MDKLDLRLLNMLQKYSSVQLVKLAGNLHMTKGMMRASIPRLGKTDIIKKFTR